jgi:hypothetical protein
VFILQDKIPVKLPKQGARWSKNQRFKGLNLLYRKLTPYLHRSRDIILETGKDKQYAPVPLLPALTKLKRGVESTQVLIINPQGKEVQKTAEPYEHAAEKGSKFSLVQLGTTKTTKQEAFMLFRKPDIITGTAERIIDHIRRGNADLSKIQYCFIFEPDPEKSQGFNADLQFILTKLNKGCKNIIFTPEIDECLNELHPFLKGPVIIPESQWYTFSPAHVACIIPNQERIIKMLPEIIKKERLKNTILICDSPKDINPISTELNTQGIKVREISEDLSDFKNNGTDASGSYGTFITSNKETTLSNLRGFRNIIYLSPIPPETYKHNYVLIEDNAKPAKIITFYSQENINLITEMEEKLKMSISRRDYTENKDDIKAKIKEILEKIRLREDPEEMNYYKKLYKKHVPVFLRAYFSAYLLRELANSNYTSKPRLTSIFIGAGKNRKVFPKDIIQLFTNVPDVEATDVGEIKILDNYSFAEVSADKAKQVIQQLNGKDFRGKSLTVNFARKKDQ